MGDLVKAPFSEVTSTLEVLDRWGVKPEHLTKFRKASSYVQSMIAQAIIRCDEKFFTGDIKHLVDCDANPFVPDGWSVEEHRKGGILTWDLAEVKLYLSKHQRGSKYIIGNDLRKELKSQPVLNANVLDYLLKPENQHLIPEDWQGKYIFFWGTIYRNSGDSLCVRCLYWDGRRWDWDYNYDWLVNEWVSCDPAAVAS